MSYKPQPIDTSAVRLSSELQGLTELLAKNAHDIWAQQRLADGWRYGPARDDTKKEHPCLIAYDQLPDAEKIYDRNTAMETIRVILSLGYCISKS